MMDDGIKNSDDGIKNGDDGIKNGKETVIAGEERVEDTVVFGPGSPVVEEGCSCGVDLDTIKNELRDLKDRYVRMMAEFDNYKKRMVKEREDIQKYRVQPLATELLSIIDNLEMAIAHGAGSPDAALLKGVELTERELKRVLASFGLVEIKAGTGTQFDPNFHEAMAQIERSDLDSNSVIEVFRKGYQFKDKLIRPATVSVSRQPQTVIDKPVEDGAK